MINIKKIKPLFNRIVTTAETYEQDEKNGSIVTKTAGTLKEFQKVIAVGDSVRSIKVGDIVQINPSRYAKRKFEDNSLKNDVISTNQVITYNFSFVTLEGTPYMMLYDSDIDYIIEDMEEVPDTPESTIVIPDKKLIV